jgi:hypothetical protein
MVDSVALEFAFLMDVMRQQLGVSYFFIGHSCYYLRREWLPKLHMEWHG